VVAGAIIAMPALAFVAYLWLGSPEYPDQPLAARQPSAGDMTTLIAAVEARLATAPDDGRGWDVIAPVYLRLGRSGDAAEAYTNAIRLLGSSAEREIGLGEAMTTMNGGTVTADANAAFARANVLVPTDPRPRFYLALALKQAGRVDEALAAWRALLADAPADAPWAAVVEEQIAALEPVPDASFGPTADDIVAAEDMTPEDRQAMIEDMVASLAARLESEPADADGWARLVRSYMVLGRAEDAHAALVKARVALSGDAPGLAAVEATARQVGVEASP
jgi:cytochrome c-type biogenesis protein CcmH